MSTEKHEGGEQRVCTPTTRRVGFRTTMSSMEASEQQIIEKMLRNMSVSGGVGLR